MTATDAKKRAAFEDFERETGGKVVKVGPGQRVKEAEKIAPVEAAETVPEPEPATPGTVTPTPAKRSGPAPVKAAEINIWKGITARVSPPTGEAYQVEFLRDGRRLCIETTKSSMWGSVKLQDNAAAAVNAAIDAATGEDEDRPAPDTIRRKIKEKFAELAEQVKTDIEVQDALMSEPVRTVLGKTKAVDVYPSKDGHGTIYEITLGDRMLTATPAQMSGRDGGFLNSAWKGLFYKSLDLSRGDWMQIRTRWEDPDLMQIHEIEESTEAEIMIDRLRLELESVSLVESPDLVNDDNSAWRDPGTGEIWVPARRITRFLDETAKKPGWSSRLSKEIRAAGWMKTPTRTKKTGNPARETRCWVFVEGFTTSRDTRNPPAIVSEYVGSNTGDETSDL